MAAADFALALAGLRPSLTVAELSRYEDLRLKYEGGGLGGGGGGGVGSSAANGLPDGADGGAALVNGHEPEGEERQAP